MKTTKCAALSVFTLLLSSSVLAQTPADVPQDHWAYSAVESLAKAGLIKGYPPSGTFFGKRTVSRYEMAIIVQRVLARVDELIAAAKPVSAPTPKSDGVSAAQLADVRKLVDDFKVELTVVGTDLKKVQTELDELSTKVAGAVTSANEAKSAAAKAGTTATEAKAAAAAAAKDAKDAKDVGKVTQGEVNTLKKYTNQHKLDGYIQSRFEAFDTGRVGLFTPTGAGGTTQTPSNGAPIVGGPWYGFNIRRARIKASGQLTERTDYILQIDAQSIGAVSLVDAAIGISDFPVKGLTARFGMMPIPFGYELPYASRFRDTPERALGWGINANDYPVFKNVVNAVGGSITSGTVLPLFLGQNRDDGITIQWASPNKVRGTKVTLGAFNGEGRSAAGVRNSNNGIDTTLRAETTLAKGLNVGTSAYYGSLAVRGGAPVSGVPVAFVNAYRTLGSVDVDWQTPWKTRIRAEYLGGVFEATPDRAQYMQNNHVWAWYLSVKQPLTKKLDFVAKYDEYAPIAQGGRNVLGLDRSDLLRKTLQGGFNYQLDSATRLRLWYTKGLTPFDPSATTGPLRTRLGLISTEVQVIF